MKLFEALKYAEKVLKEYATDEFGDFGKTFTSLGGKNGMSNGKKADNIASGESEQYKDDRYLTAYERKLPNLAKLTQKLKDQRPVYAVTVLGPALEELKILMKVKSPLKKDENGEYILPLGDHIRLYKSGSVYMIRYVPDKKEGELTAQDIQDDERLVSGKH